MSTSLSRAQSILATFQGYKSQLDDFVCPLSMHLPNYHVSLTLSSPRRSTPRMNVVNVLSSHPVKSPLYPKR
jgi:hypothetical protein